MILTKKHLDRRTMLKLVHSPPATVSARVKSWSARCAGRWRQTTHTMIEDAARVAATVNWQTVASCRIVAFWALTLIVLCRADVAGFWATWNCTWPGPCPCVGDKLVIHAASAVAVQAHSGVVSTPTVPLAPPASNGADGDTHLFRDLLV